MKLIDKPFRTLPNIPQYFDESVSLSFSVIDNYFTFFISSTNEHLRCQHPF